MEVSKNCLLIVENPNLKWMVDFLKWALVCSSKRMIKWSDCQEIKRTSFARNMWIATIRKRRNCLLKKRDYQRPIGTIIWESAGNWNWHFPIETANGNKDPSKSRVVMSKNPLVPKMTYTIKDSKSGSKNRWTSSKGSFGKRSRCRMTASNSRAL